MADDFDLFAQEVSSDGPEPTQSAPSPSRSTTSSSEPAATQSEEERKKRLALVLLGLLAVIGILTAALLFLRGREVLAMLPFSVGRGKEDLTVEATPPDDDVVELPALPTAPPATPVPVETLSLGLVRVTGEASYTSSYPWVTQIHVTLPRGDPVQVEATCDACLWEETPAAVTLEKGAQATFSLAVIPPNDAHLVVRVNGEICAEWSLVSSNEGLPYEGTCVP